MRSAREDQTRPRTLGGRPSHTRPGSLKRRRSPVLHAVVHGVFRLPDFEPRRGKPSRKKLPTSLLRFFPSGKAARIGGRGVVLEQAPDCKAFHAVFSLLVAGPFRQWSSMRSAREDQTRPRTLGGRPSHTRPGQIWLRPPIKLRSGHPGSSPHRRNTQLVPPPPSPFVWRGGG